MTKRSEQKTIAWLVNRLDAVGGGERLLFEGAKHYRELGYRVIIYTWFFDERALFNGAYENKDIFVLTTNDAPRSNIIARALSRGRTLLRLRDWLKEHHVTTLFVQGEYDVALAYIATRFTTVRYRFLIFGQIFQYPHDHAKYALGFRRHLREIVASRAGYAQTIPLDPPKLSFANRVANELICWVRRRAVRKAEKRFSFTRQIQWETELLFGCSTIIASGAFPLALLTREDFDRGALARYGLGEKQYLLALSRLDRKKRIDLIIDGYARSGVTSPLVIAGAGADEAFLRECAERNPARDRIRFMGLVDEADLIPLKRYAALFVSMDIGDYDISPLEALAVGVPILCPTDLDADAHLRAMPAVTIVDPAPEPVGAAVARMMASPPPVDRAALAPYAWETYFDQLIAD